MKKLITIIIAISHLYTNAQPCDGFNANTFQHTTSVWDWTNSSPANWGSYILNGTNPPNYFELASPFESAGIAQPNTEHLYLGQATRDYLPSEGWELVIKRFGQNSTTQAVSNPMFILYNRFRGIMRVFVCIIDPDDAYTGALLEVLFNNSTNLKASAILESGNSTMNALDKFEKGFNVKIPNKINVEETYQWIYADIPVNYDPCTCSSSPNDNNVVTPNVSALKLRTLYLQTTTAMLQLNEITADQTKVSNGGVVSGVGNSTIQSSVNNAVDIYGGAVKKGNEVKKTVESAVNGANGVLNALNGISNMFTKAEEEELKKKGVELPSFIKQLPYVGFLFGALEYLIAGGKKTDKANASVPIAPKKYSLNGTLDAIGQMSEYTVYTPGSPYESINPSPNETPVYDYVMGVFTLLETPKVEWVRYLAPVTRENVVMPRIIQYRLKEPLKYIVNPASELEIKDIKVALEYQLVPHTNIRLMDNGHKLKFTGDLFPSGTITDLYFPFVGPVLTYQSQPNATYLEKMENSGIYISNWPTQNKRSNDSKGQNSLYNITYSTGFFNPTCIDIYSFAIADYNLGLNTTTPLTFLQCGQSSINITPNATDQGLKFDGNNLDVKLKVRVVLKRTDSDADANTEDVVILQTYNVNIEAEPALDNGTYAMNLSCMNLTDSSTYGVDYFVQSLNPSTGNSAIPLGDAAYPNELTFAFGNSIYGSNKKIYARKKITILNSISTTNNNVSAIFRAGEEIVVEPGAEIGANVTLEIKPQPFDCDGESTPVSMAQVLGDYCPNLSKYNPIMTKTDDVETIVKHRDNYLTIYPNPTYEMLNIVFESPILVNKIQTVSVDGRLVHEEFLNYSIKSRQISTSTLTSGTYQIVVHATEGKIVKPFVKIGE